MSAALTLEALDRIAGRKVDRGNAAALIEALRTHPAGLDRPHRLAQFVPQVMHESGGLKYAAEIWGPTAQQLRYECDPSRPWSADDARNKLAFQLGNSEPGDGARFRGYGLIQNTGRANATAFRDWCWREELPAPDFALFPEKQAESPWAGLVAVWYWTSRELNRFADEGNVEWITRRINGGLTGYADRLRWHWRTSLVLLGYGTTTAEIRKFQTAARLTVDGLVGPKTRGAMHEALVRVAAPAEPPTVEARLAALEADAGALKARVAALEAA